MLPQELKALEITACKIRMDILTATHAAKCGHPGGSLSAADLFTYLYFHELRVDPKNPQDPDRDRFVLSKGHTAPGLYSALAERGFFPVEDLKTLRRIDSYLQGHPNMNHVPGVDMSTGSVGQGISCACGIDNNGLQIDGAVDKVMSPYPIDEKLKAFGFHVICINGNDMADIDRAMQEAKTVKGQPTAILMKTTKGKGVSYMEGKAEWHGKAPNDEQYELGLAELRSALSELEGK